MQSTRILLNADLDSLRFEMRSFPVPSSRTVNTWRGRRWPVLAMRVTSAPRLRSWHLRACTFWHLQRDLEQICLVVNVAQTA